MDSEEFEEAKVAARKESQELIERLRAETHSKFARIPTRVLEEERHQYDDMQSPPVVTRQPPSGHRIRRAGHRHDSFMQRMNDAIRAHAHITFFHHKRYGTIPSQAPAAFLKAHHTWTTWSQLPLSERVADMHAADSLAIITDPTARVAHRAIAEAFLAALQQEERVDVPFLHTPEALQHTQAALFYPALADTHAAISLIRNLLEVYWPALAASRLNDPEEM